MTVVQVASEWGQAKAEASQAKAAGDKNKQKSIGLVIRSLKQEMKELGCALERLLCLCKCTLDITCQMTASTKKTGDLIASPAM